LSRVGGNAQTKAMKKVAGPLRLNLSQYRELAAFAQFGSDLDKATRAQLARGERMVEILKQDQYAPIPLTHQVVMIYAGVNGFLDDIEVAELRRFETHLLKFLDVAHGAWVRELEEKKELTAEIEAKLKIILAEGKEQWKAARSERAA